VTDFTQLGLIAPLLKALAAEGYSSPTPIQTQAIPVVLEGRDLIGLAQTGTGKTAAFALPILQRLSASPRPQGFRSARALVLAPTRELAGQIADAFRTYGRLTGLSTLAVFGGASMHKQKEALRRGVDILVATPGRLLDHVEERTIRLDGVELLVLDEADHMLDMGFIHDLNRIARLLPKQRQSLFFSATMPEAISDLAARYLTNPVRVAVTPVSSTTERIRQSVIHVPQARKQELLHHLLQDKSISRVLVFTRTKHGANRVSEKLEAAGFNAAAIHGNRSQGQRERALAAFKAGEARVLVATEIAARGIDVDLVTHVINFDLPNVPEQYVHRVGRTARAGAEGQAISFCAPDERPFLRGIEKLIRKPVPVAEHALGATPTPLDTSHADVVRSDRRDDRPGHGRGQGQGQKQGQRQGARRGQGGAGHRKGGAPHGASAQDRPHQDRPRDDRPRDDRPREDRPREDRPAAQARPQSARPQGERPRQDGPRQDRPRQDRPRQDGPRQDRPANSGQPHRNGQTRSGEQRTGEPRNNGPRPPQGAPGQARTQQPNRSRNAPPRRPRIDA
jgi:ATP-dependent RNA helicase RhlE